MIDQLILGLTSFFAGNSVTNFFEEQVQLPAQEIIQIETSAEWNAVAIFDLDGKDLSGVNYFAEKKWQKVPLAHERNDISELIFFSGKQTQKKMVLKANHDVNLGLHFFNSHKKEEKMTASFVEENTTDYLEKADIAQELDFGTTNIPRFYSRSEWGADESLRLSKNINAGSKWYQVEINALDPKYRPKTIRQTDDDGNPLYWPIMENENIAKFVIHHTAENLQQERNRTAKEIMRAIYYYHTITRGWGDIGYNFVIDRYGNVYEGRSGYEKNRRIPVGAHVSFRNVGTVGISLMGNFQEEKPTKAQMNVAALLISDLGRQLNINPLSKSVFHGKYGPNILGHGQIAARGHGTACPGKNMILKLPELRKKVRDFTAELKSFEKNGYRTGLDFLTGSSATKSFLKSRDFSIKRTENPLWVSKPNNPPIIRRNESKTVDIYVKNKGNTTWRKSLSITPKNVPEGMVFSKFYLTGTTDPGRNGIFRGTVYVKDTPNGKYSVDFVPYFLSNRLSDYLVKKATFGYEIQVSGDKRSLVASIKDLSIFKSLQTNTFGKPINSNSSKAIVSNFSQKSLFSKNYNQLENNYGPTVKVKLASFNKDYEEIMGSTEVSLWNKGQVFAKVPAYATIKIKINKIAGKEDSITVSVGDNNWDFRRGEDILFVSTGFLELLKYNNARFGSGSVKYNKFRGKLRFKIAKNRHFLVINELPIEQYLWGLGEEPSSEPLNKKHTVLILARSYAYVYSGPKRKFGRYDYDLEDDPRTSQLYLGYDWERYHNSQRDLVDQTRGKVLYLNSQNRAVIGPYFTQSAGFSVNPWRSQYPWARERELPYDKGLVQRGHGVGLSGNSARILAEKGATIQEIVDYFFSGLSIKKVY